MSYNGYLLVASKKLSGGQSWQSIAIYSNPDNKKVEVLVFDCNTPGKIKKILSEQISEIEFNPAPTQQEIKNLALLRKLAEKISAVRHQEVPKQLLCKVKRNFTVIEKEYCIFLPEE